MKNLVNFILWPAIGGLVFALTLLLAPRLVGMMPGLANYFFPEAAVSTARPASAPLSYSAAIKTAAPAVVSINFKSQEELIPEMYYPESNSLGSGVIISPDGFIITSYHIFFNEEDQETLSPDISVTLSDGRTVVASVVRTDEENDLILLKVFAEGLPYLSLADTSRLEVGDVVLAIGNPRNIGQSSTFGIISALTRRDDGYMIQTDAAINPGNSGGALIDVTGKLIGINSTIVSESGGSEGISFSIPADKAINLLDQYLASGPSGYLGVSAKYLTLAEGRERFGKDMQGFLVRDVPPGSPADKAGVQINDVITSVNEMQLSIIDENDMGETFQSILRAISSLPPGQEISMEVIRGDTILELTAILGVGEPQVYKVVEERE